MKKILGLTFASAAAAALSFFFAKALATQAILEATKTPFTIHFRDRHVITATGRTVTTRETLYGVRSDGSKVEAELDVTADRPAIVSRTLRLVPERKRVLIYEKTGSTTTEYFPESAVVAFKQSAPSDTCIAPELAGQVQLIGTGEFLGYRVIKLQQHEAGVSREDWAAPDLNCDWLYSKIEFKKPDGSVYETSEFIPVSITPGEPDPDLFAIKPAYRELPPSAAYGAATGNQISESVRQRLPARDQVYFESQKFAPK